MKILFSIVGTATLIVAAILLCNSIAVSTSSRLHKDVHQITRFANALRDYGRSNGRFPAPPLFAAIAAVRSFAIANKVDYEIDWVLLEQGRTPFNGNVVYEVSDNGKNARIYSTGQNRLDEHGKGDDIVATVELGAF